MKGKNTFTKNEIKELEVLIQERLKAQADGVQQKPIRDKMRKIGFYGGDDFGIKDLNLNDFQNLINTGRILVK